MQSDPAWVAIELYSRVVSPLQLLAEFPDIPYVPFGQQQYCTLAANKSFLLGSRRVGACLSDNNPRFSWTWSTQPFLYLVWARSTFGVLQQSTQ